MNGRIYDPLLGRFLSADKLVQAPGDLQSFNRFSYVFNNPLSNVDSDGFKSNPAHDRWDPNGPIRLPTPRSMNLNTERTRRGENAREKSRQRTDITVRSVRRGHHQAGIASAVLIAAASLPFIVPELVVTVALDDTSDQPDVTDENIEPAPADGTVDPEQQPTQEEANRGVPRNPDDLLEDGFEETSHPDAVKKGHRNFENPETGDKLRHDEGTEGADGHEGRDHYHRPNPNSTSKRDANLDKDGNPVPRGSNPSHLYPEEEEK